MTPTGTRLKARLADRRRWFTNEWFFKWHFIGSDGPVSIDSFDDRGIHLGGIKFCGSARLVYWEAVVRGVQKEITEQFAWIDQEVRNYTPATALLAIDECAGQLTSFAKSIREEAIAKDRVLRGDGITFPAADDAGLWDGTSATEIAAQAMALKAALPLSIASSPPATSWWERRKTWHEPLGWAIAAGGVVVPAIWYLVK